MKNKKLLKIITIILTIVIILVDICLFIKMRTNWGEIGYHDQYENAGLILKGLFTYGSLVWGILLIPMLWIQYFLINLLLNFLINLLLKIYNGSNKKLRYLLCLLILIAIIAILVFIIKILYLIIMAVIYL